MKMKNKKGTRILLYITVLFFQSLQSQILSENNYLRQICSNIIGTINNSKPILLKKELRPREEEEDVLLKKPKNLHRRTDTKVSLIVSEASNKDCRNTSVNLDNKDFSILDVYKISLKNQVNAAKSVIEGSIDGNNTTQRKLDSASDDDSVITEAYKGTSLSVKEDEDIDLEEIEDQFSIINEFNKNAKHKLKVRNDANESQIKSNYHSGGKKSGLFYKTPTNKENSKRFDFSNILNNRSPTGSEEAKRSITEGSDSSTNTTVNKYKREVKENKKTDPNL